MKNVAGSLMLALFIAISCQSPDDTNDISEPLDQLIGLWKFEDGRHFQLKTDSVMIVYWEYPSNSDKSIWHRAGEDSLYLYFDGPHSDVVYRYKILELKDFNMQLWDSHGVYELTKIQ